MVEKILSENEYFYLSTGVAIKSISELRNLLDGIDSGVFSSHVNDSKNDFYNWVKGAFKNSELASRIKSSKTPLDMARAIDSYNAVLTRPILKSSAAVENLTNHKLSPKPVYPKKVETSDFDSLKKITKLASKNLDSSLTNKSLAKSLKSDSKVVSNKPLDSLFKKEDSKISDSFDYSLNMDNQKDVLSQIKERISLMDKELQVSTKKFSDLDDISKSLEALDNSYPESSDLVATKKSIKPKKSVVHHIKHVTKKAHEHVTRHAKNVHAKIKGKVDESKKRSEIKKYLKKSASKIKSNDKKIESKSESSSLKHLDRGVENKIEKLDFDVVNSVSSSDRDMRDTVDLDEKGYYDANEVSDNSDLKKSVSKKDGFFKGFLSRLKNSAKIVKSELPNLHEFEHERRAEERIGPYTSLEHKKNYHIHGVPDFVRGLIIGIVVGMLFLVIF